jgi:cytochrome c peroxidase
MKYAVSSLLFAGALVSTAAAQSPLREQTLRRAAINAGVVPLETIRVPVDTQLADVGGELFQSDLLSFNGDMSCQTCHLDQFSSADGLPNAVGTQGKGEGADRLMSGKGDIVPRNTLPLWGRGSKGFDTFFWDGKVRASNEGVVSQFGEAVPSDDPLVVAVHLPFVEIREMVVRDREVKAEFEKEETNAATSIFDTLAARVREDRQLGPELAAARSKSTDQLEFVDIAIAVAAFIRDKFAVRRTAFDDFVFGDGKLSAEAVQGGLIFYGKGACSSCHSGPLMSDLDFHAMPFGQLGFGKNGFGVDYGRYNTTLEAADLYLFRTPPLVNVTKTAPYTHSGAIGDLTTMIQVHADPLLNYDGHSRTSIQRREDLARLLAWGGASQLPEPLSEKEVKELIAFLTTLETTDE